MARPDIFIVGAMKGGTTILYDYLCTHPRIRPGKAKEIHYFSLFPHLPPDWYLGHFEGLPDGARTIDASPTYFDAAATPAIPRMIDAFAPDARIVLIVRDPVERALSHFVHLKHTARIPELAEMSANKFFDMDFLAAFRQTSSLQMYLNQVLWFSLYFRKFLMFKTVFQDRMIELRNEDLRRDARATMRRVYAFLGLDYVHDDLIGQERYRTEGLREPLSAEVAAKLKDFLTPDYDAFLRAAGIESKRGGA